VFFWWDLGYGLVGLITGLIFLRMTNYKSFKDIMWAELFSLIGIIVGLGLASISEIWVSGADISTILSTIFIPTAGTNAINGFILLPILMIVYAAIAQLSGR
jgi:energy-coupling factor transport system substrate-specific component